MLQGMKVLVSSAVILCLALLSFERAAKIVTTDHRANVFKTFLRDDAIKTEPKDGVVTSAGTVNEASDKQPEPPLAEIIDDASIYTQVRMTLFTHRSSSPSSPSFRTTVATNKGVVTVGGMAKNTAEINLVTKLVTNVHGVKSVVNRMVVEAAVTKN